MIISGGDDNVVRIWDTTTSALLAQLDDHLGYIRSISVSPCGMLLATSDGSTVAIRCFPSGMPRAIIRGLELFVGIAFSPNGKHLATASQAGSVVMWDAYTGKEDIVFEGDGVGLTSIAFSPDGKTLVTGNLRWQVQWWDTTTGRERAKVDAHYFPVSSVAFSPSGEFVASTAWGSSWIKPPEAVLWDSQSLRQRAALKGHKGGLTAVAFFPNGRALVTASWDKTLRVWDLAR